MKKHPVPQPSIHPQLSVNTLGGEKDSKDGMPNLYFSSRDLITWLMKSHAVRFSNVRRGNHCHSWTVGDSTFVAAFVITGS